MRSDVGDCIKVLVYEASYEAVASFGKLSHRHAILHVHIYNARSRLRTMAL